MFTVYEGILTRMVELGDEPATDEAAELPEQTTVAYGKSGTRYVYIRSTNTIHTFRPDPA